MKLGIDMDGTLASFVNAYSVMILRETGHALEEESDDFPDIWDFDRARLKKESYSDEQIDTMLGKVWERITRQGSTFWSMLPAYPGVADALYRLSERIAYGDEIYFVTVRPGHMVKWQTEMWLTVHGMQHPTVLIVKEKGPVVASLGLDVFVDDKPEYLENISQASPQTRLYMIDRPYNRWATAESYGRRVKGLGDVLDIEFVGQRMARAA